MRLLCLLLLSACAPAFTWAPVASIKRPTAAEFPDVPAVILRRDVKYQVVLPYKRQPYYRERRHQLLAILSEGGFHYAEVKIPLVEDDTLRFLKARTISPDGQVQEVTPEQVLDEHARDTAAHDQHKTSHKTFRLPGVKVGCLLEYVYEVESPRFLWWRAERMSSELPILHHHVELSFGPNIEFALKAYNRVTPFTRQTLGDEVRVQMDLDDIPASRTESLSPPWQLVEPWWAYRALAYTRFNRHIAYERWPDALKELAKSLYLDNKKYYAGASLRQGQSCGSDRRCVVEQAVAFVRDQTELTHFDSTLLDVRPMKEVLQSRQASSFEKAFLLRGAFEASGVESYFLLVARNAGLAFDHDFPLPAQYDHLMLLVPPQPGVSDVLFIDPSCEQCALGQLSLWTEGREALLVKAVEKLGEPEVSSGFVPLSGAAPMGSGEHREIDAHLSANGSVDGTLLVEKRGRAAVDSQIANRKRSTAHWRKAMEGVITHRHKTAHLEYAEPQHCDKRTASCSWRGAFTLPGYAAVDGDRLVVPLTFLGSPWDTQVDRERHNDVFMRYSELDEEIMTVRLPEGYVVEELPPPAQLTSPAMDARLEVTSAPGLVTLKRSVQTHAGSWDRSHYPEVAVVLQGLARWRQNTFTVKVRKAAQ